jgi:hypothetical protein
MTVIWLIVWLVEGTPDVVAWGPWNSWGVALFVCLGLDLIAAIGRSGSGRRRRQPAGKA